MKKIEAIIRDTKFQEVKNTLTNLVPKRKIEIVCIEEEVNKIVNSIASNAATGKPGDGKIFVLDVQDVIRIRTTEQGQDAI